MAADRDDPSHDPDRLFVQDVPGQQPRRANNGGLGAVADALENACIEADVAAVSARLREGAKALQDLASDLEGETRHRLSGIIRDLVGR